MLDYLLPIGSVVTLEEGKHKLMIFRSEADAQ